MSNIGNFTAQGKSFTGSVRTLTLNVKVKFVPNDKQGDKAPDYRIVAGTFEIGAAWKKLSKAEQRPWMASVSWDYPKDRMLALQKQAQQAQAAAPVDSGLSLEQIKFRYAITGDSPPWKPLRAFDDGQRVYIQFPGGIAQGELPPLFVVGPQGDGQLVNYRFRSPYFVVDRLFGAAELRLGADKAQVVRIERTDGVASAVRRN